MDKKLYKSQGDRKLCGGAAAWESSSASTPR